MCSLWATTLARPSFESAEVTSVTDAFQPYEVVFDGFVVLDLSLDKDGEMIGTEVLRDPGAMVPAAVKSARTWRIRPALIGSAPVSSEMTAVFVYRPRPNGLAVPVPPKDFKPVVPHPRPRSDEAIDYVPAGIVSVTYPEYPVNSVAWGSVIVQVTVDADGKVETTKVLQGLAPFTDLVLDALRNWRFQAATLQGKDVSSKLPIAFVFQTPSPSP